VRFPQKLGSSFSVACGTMRQNSAVRSTGLRIHLTRDRDTTVAARCRDAFHDACRFRRSASGRREAADAAPAFAVDGTTQGGSECERRS
jgi:plasmid replication initiation protein